MTLAIGMNLAQNVYYGTEMPFLDRLKTASGWMASGGDGSPPPVDANGYPTAMPPGASNIYVVVAMDQAPADGTIRHVLRYTGSAEFLFVGGKIVSAVPGRVEFDWYPQGGRQMPLQVQSLDPAHPLTKMAVVRADQEVLLDAGEIFNPVFLSKIEPFDTLRYMDWCAANTSQDVEWADRKPSTAMTWQSAGSDEVPIEVIIALANETRTNPWLNVPMRASDDYVRQLVTYVHDHLDPALSLHLEYANEVFNWATGVAGYAKEQADKLWPGDAGVNWMTWGGYRAAQIASIARDVFGADAGRLHMVMAVQTAWEGLEDAIVEGVSRAKLGTVNDLFDDYAVTTYFGNLSGDNDADKATVLGWAKDGAAGLDAAFQAMKDGTGLTSFGSLKGLQPFYAYHAGVATKLGLDLVAYEGGPGMTATSYAPADQAEVVAFFGCMESDPRMGEIVTQMATDFAAAGGTLLNVFNDAGLDSAWGTWGILKTIDGTSPAYDALVALTAKRASAPVTPPVATPVAEQPNPTPTPVAEQPPVAGPTPDPVATEQPNPATKPEPIDDPVDTPVETVRPSKEQVAAALGVLKAATANAEALLTAYFA